MGEIMIILFFLIVILIMLGWIIITLNGINKSINETHNELWKKITNMQNQQDGINYNVDGLYEYLVIAQDKKDIEDHKKELEERYKEDK